MKLDERLYQVTTIKGTKAIGYLVRDKKHKYVWIKPFGCVGKCRVDTTKLIGIYCGEIDEYGNYFPLPRH